MQTNSCLIAVYSPKGGVGKTSLSVELAWRFAMQGQLPTLLWDTDPQAGASFLLDVWAKNSSNVASVFYKLNPLQFVQSTKYALLDMLCADPTLRFASDILARCGPRPRLVEAAMRLKCRYRRIIIDCPPSQNELSRQVLAAADLLVVPAPPAPIAARGVDLLAAELREMVGRHPPVLVVMSMYDHRRKDHRAARVGSLSFAPVIPLSAYMEQVGTRHEPVGSFAPGSAASQALDRLWQGIEQKCRELATQSAPSISPVPSAREVALTGFRRLMTRR